MKAYISEDPDLPLYIGENEVGRVSFGESVDILNWDIDEVWAYVQYKDTLGYAKKKGLKTEKDMVSKRSQDEEDNLPDFTSYSTASGRDLPYVVVQVTLKEKFFGTGSGNLTDLENVINLFFQMGYRLHTMSTATSDGSKGLGGGDRIQATLVFERINLF